MLEPAGGGDHHVTGAVVACPIVDEVRPLQDRDRLAAAQQRTAERLTGEGGLLEVIEDHVVGRVRHLPDFLQDDRTLAGQFGLVEHRILHDVRNQVERQRQVFRQDLRMKGRRLAPRIGIEVAAHRLDLLGNVLRRTPLGALEDHVFQEMRDAVQLGALVPSADPHPGPQRDGLHGVHLVGRNRQAVGQAGHLDSHAAPAASAAGRP